MMERSILTLQSLPNPDEIYKEMVRLYVEEHGFDELHDAYKSLLPVDPKKIGIELFSAIEKTNQDEMIKNGYCPDCGVQLQIKSYSKSEWIHCPSCHDDFAEVV